MATGRITSKNYMLNVHSQLLFRLSHYPNISLVAVIERIGIRVSWSISIINTKNWHINFIRPLSCVVLVSCTILTHESSTMEVNDNSIDNFFIFLIHINCLIFKICFKCEWTEQPNLNMSFWIVSIFVNVILCIFTFKI